MTAIVDSSTGKLIMRISAPDDVVKMNTPEGCLAVEDPPEPNMYYQDGWVAMPTQPSPYHTFDYTTKQWIDPRTLDEIKAQKWSEIKAERDRLEYGGFEFEGNLYDSDEKSQARISAAASLGVAVEWTLADNSTIWLEPADLQRLVVALATHITTIHTRGKIAREKIYNATTIAEVEAVKL